MGYVLDMKPDGDVLRVRISGTVDSGSLAHDTDEAEGIALACISSRCKGILLDVRNVSFDVGVRERFRGLAVLATATPSRVRLAALGVPKDLREDEQGQAADGVRGSRYRVFDSETEALAWLADG